MTAPKKFNRNKKINPGSAAEDSFLSPEVKAGRALNKSLWYKTALMVMALLLGISYYSSITAKDEVAAVLVRTNPAGWPLEVARIDNETLLDLREEEIQAVLYHVIELWRIRTNEVEAERKRYTNIFRNYLRAASRAKFENIVTGGNLHPFITLKNDEKYEPLKDVGAFTSKIKLNNMHKADDNIYSFEILETVYGAQGAEKESYPLSITFAIEQRRPRRNEEVLQNPYGIYITDIVATAKP